MSLLMDALKRAEMSKQETGRANPRAAPAPEAETLTLTELPPETSASKPLPDLSHYLDAVDAELLSQAKPVDTVDFPPDDRNRQAVRNAFAAKALPPTTGASQLRWVFLSAAGLACLAIVAYFWYALNHVERGTLGAPPVADATRSMPAAETSPMPEPPLPQTQPSAASGTPLPLPPTYSSPPSAPRRAVSEAEPAPGTAQPAVRLTKVIPSPDNQALRAHALMQRGEIEAARREYEQVLLRTPNDTETLLALAAIAASQGRSGDAQSLRQRALIANPSDPATQAAVIAGPASEGDPQGAESRLKTLLTAQPESPSLNFALGNLYARQNRWSEAQQAYFNAVAAKADNPDYLFNLAISLDHLRQPRLAAQHYRLALEAANRHPAGFNRKQAEDRLADLLPANRP